MLRQGLLLALLAQGVVGVSAAPRHFELLAVFEPARQAGGEGAVAVTFQPLDPDVKVNEVPAPRLKLDLAQTVLEDRQPQPQPHAGDFDPATAHYLDTTRPVRFKVALSKHAPRGEHEVSATVVYFYCSTREAWCRRGSATVEIPVTVP
jgi:hypothetical protein